jgi:hypothetical protein
MKLGDFFRRRRGRKAQELYDRERERRERDRRADPGADAERLKVQSRSWFDVGGGPGP